MYVENDSGLYSNMLCIRTGSIVCVIRIRLLRYRPSSTKVGSEAGRLCPVAGTASPNCCLCMWLTASSLPGRSNTSSFLGGLLWSCGLNSSTPRDSKTLVACFRSQSKHYSHPWRQRVLRSPETNYAGPRASRTAEGLGDVGKGGGRWRWPQHLLQSAKTSGPLIKGPSGT